MSSHSRISRTLLTAALMALVVSLAVVGASSARKRLGNGPSLTSGRPVKGQLPRNRDLIVVEFSKDKVLSVTGTAVPPTKRRTTKRKLGAVRAATCTVNFTHSTQHSSGKTRVRWYAGIGCDRTMFLFGEAYLQESATTIDGSGGHYQGNLKSALSGRESTTVDAAHPSLYIRHLTNVFFTSAGSSGKIIVKPAAGQVLNAASKCEAVEMPGQGVGVHCDLYTNRFS